jgi:hypothetical protein
MTYFFPQAKGAPYATRFREIQGQSVVGVTKAVYPSRRLVLFHAKCSIRRYPLISAPNLDLAEQNRVETILALSQGKDNREGTFSVDAIDPLVDQKLSTQVERELNALNALTQEEA